MIYILLYIYQTFSDQCYVSYTNILLAARFIMPLLSVSFFGFFSFFGQLKSGTAH